MIRKTSWIQKGRRWSLSLLASGVFSLAVYGNNSDVSTVEDVTTVEVTDTASTDQPAVKDGKIVYVPQACSVVERLRCMLDNNNIQTLQYILNMLTVDKGNSSLVLSTEHFEELLAKMREPGFGAIDIESIKKNPEACYDKLLPILELITKHSKLPLTTDMIGNFCEQASSYLRAYSMLTSLVGSVSEHPFLSGLAGISSAAYALTKWKPDMAMNGRLPAFVGIAGLVLYTVIPGIAGH